MTQQSVDLATPSVRRGLLVAAGVMVAPLSALVVGLLALTDTDQVPTHSALSSLGFGWPMNWLDQDQSSLDPVSFPQVQSFLSPWDYPARVEAAPLFVDLLVVLTSLLAVLLILRKLSRYRRGSGPQISAVSTARAAEISPRMPLSTARRRCSSRVCPRP